LHICIEVERLQFRFGEEGKTVCICQLVALIYSLESHIDCDQITVDWNVGK
jgi:hypothetical protein